MDNPKTRVRSKEELISREKGLIDIIDILNKNKIYYFLQAGVVLGARRDNYFITQKLFFKSVIPIILICVVDKT